MTKLSLCQIVAITCLLCVTFVSIAPWLTKEAEAHPVAVVIYSIRHHYYSNGGSQCISGGERHELYTILERNAFTLDFSNHDHNQPHWHGIQQATAHAYHESYCWIA